MSPFSTVFVETRDVDPSGLTSDTVGDRSTLPADLPDRVHRKESRTEGVSLLRSLLRPLPLIQLDIRRPVSSLLDRGRAPHSLEPAGGRTPDRTTPNPRREGSGEGGVDEDNPTRGRISGRLTRGRPTTLGRAGKPLLHRRSTSRRETRTKSRTP